MPCGDGSVCRSACGLLTQLSTEDLPQNLQVLITSTCRIPQENLLPQSHSCHHCPQRPSCFQAQVQSRKWAPASWLLCTRSGRKP